MRDITDAIEARQDEHIETLASFLRIPSVSAEPEHADDVKRAAEFIADHLRAIGVENVQIRPTKRHPIVTGEVLHAAGAPTVLCYGHYDVQPDEPLEKWTTPPYEPVIKDGKIFARGATDDKGQLLCHVHAVEAFLKVREKLPVNVKFLIEGEEEIASENLDEFVKNNREELACDVVLVSDTSMPGAGQPAITYGLRGLTYMQIDVQGASSDLHSGSYGGAVQNPANALATIIASMKDADGRILIDGFYDDVLALDDHERTEMAKVPYDEASYKADLGVADLFGEKGYTTIERLSARPTLDVNGMGSGYQGDGAKTVLPAAATAKVSMRLVPNQDPAKIAKLFRAHVEKVSPAGVTIKVDEFSGGNPFLTPLTEPALAKAGVALEKGFGAKPVYMREGGSIPVVATLAEQLDAPVLLLGFGLHSERAHAPDEHFHLENYLKGTKTIAHLFDELAK